MREFTSDVTFKDGTVQEAPLSGLDTPASQLYSGMLEAYEQLGEGESAHVQVFYRTWDGKRNEFPYDARVVRVGAKLRFTGENTRIAGRLLTRRQLAYYARRAV